MSSQAAHLAHTAPFRIGRVLVEPGLCVVRIDGGEQSRVEPRVMQVLVTLEKARGMLLSRDDLRAACWDGRLTSDDAIDRVIAQIRRLGEGIGKSSFTVETVPKVGYRLVRCEGAEPGRNESSPRYSRRSVLGATGAVGALAAGGVLYHLRSRRNPPSLGRPVTIAVLPFTSESPSPQLAGFASALSDEVRSDVSRVTDLRVIAQTSSRKAASEGTNAQQIGSSLGADYLVEGEVGGANNVIVTRLALIETKGGSQVWTAQETAPLSDPTGLRPAIGGDIIQHLAGIVPISAKPAVPVERPDPQVYAMIQAANRLIESSRTTEMRGRRSDALLLGQQADELARRALAIDPNSSDALAVLAAITRNGWTPKLARQRLTTKQRVQASVAIIRRALFADPGNPAALTALGDYYRRFAFRWDEAENLFRRALAVDPSSVDAHWSYAYELGTLGRAVEGLDHALSVFELDPRNPFRRIALPRLLYLVGDRGSAMKRYNAELDEEPDNLFLLRELYFMFLAEGNGPDLERLGERIEHTRQASVRPTDMSALAERVEGGRLALEGNPGPLRALVDSEVKRFDEVDASPDATPEGRARDDLPFIFAIEYAWAAQPDKAIDMLDRALVAKSLYWPATLPFGIAQFPKAVRDNPRFRGLWLRDPGLSELVRRRRAAIETRQMAGFSPDGTKVTAVVPAILRQRVEQALRNRR